jgi:hypothetical protein
MREVTPNELYQHANKTIGVAINATRLGDNVRAQAARQDAKELRGRAAELTRKIGL